MAGVSTKEIKNRIRSMESTKQITKAMEMVASSKLRRAQAQVAASRPYFEILFRTIDEIVASNRDLSSPFLVKPKCSTICYVVIAGDRGLAGGYNSNVLKAVAEKIQDQDAIVLPIGKKAVDFFKSRKIPLWTESYAEAASVTVGDCFSIAKQLSQGYLDGKIGEIHVGYTEFESLLSQNATTLQLLPLQHNAAEGKTGSGGILYESGSESVFSSIVPEYLGGILYGTICESRASEQAARRSAMDSATSNAEDMIADLSLKFNRARQAAITQEITEIVAGS